MERRHFIQLTTASAAAILFNRITYATSKPGINLMNQPDEVWVYYDEKLVQLIGSNGIKYSYEDILVNITPQANVTGVFIQTPTKALYSVTLKWKHAIPKTALILGDHWERSYGDLAWKPIAKNIKNPWYALIHDGKNTTCFGVKTGANTLCWWHFNEKYIELTLDTRSGGNGVLLGDRTLHAADIITTHNEYGEDPFWTDHRFCGMMCEKPRLPAKPVYGINDWYFAYGNNSFELIERTTGMMAELVTNHDNKPFSVIDAGWALYSPYFPGDGGWNDEYGNPNDKFKDMRLMADTIKNKGMRPGLWMRPLCGRHDEKHSLLAPSIPGRDDPRRPVIDPTIPENLARIENYFSIYKEWGYELIKHDYTTYDLFGRWGSDMLNDITVPGWHFYDRSKTNAEIILQLYKTIRDAADDHMYIIGCNTISHLSAGLFELCRIGDDTSGKDWSRTTQMGVNALAFRLPQHNKFYATDGDCVGLTTDISWQHNKQWLQLLAESSSPLFISAQSEAMGIAQKQAVKQAFKQASVKQPLGQPMDWMDTREPKKWKLNNRIVTFDWT